MIVAPYLFFDGTCRAAMTAYAEILGGETLAMMTFADAPPGEMPDAPRDLILHAAIRVAGQLIMASDDVPGRYAAPVSTHVSLSPRSFYEGRRIFDRLADGGEVSMPYQKVFWTDGFGALRDRWGTLWMISVDSGSA